MTEREALTVFRTTQKCRNQALHTNDCGNCERCQFYHTQEQLDEAVDLAISALENQEQDRWIPVTERLPEEEGCYMVTVKNDHKRRYSKTAWYCGDGWFARQDIIAWRMTPEPYKAEEES
jgi:hypothetical protein